MLYEDVSYSKVTNALEINYIHIVINYAFHFKLITSVFANERGLRNETEGCLNLRLQSYTLLLLIWLR